MNKNTLIALAVLAVLGVAALVLSQGDDKAPAPLAYSVPAAAVDRVTVTDGAATVELSKKDGAWRLTKPIDYPIDPTLTQALDDAVTKGLTMDMSAPPDQAARYEVTDASPKVVLHKGSEQVAAFALGKELTVPATNVKRTFIRPDGSDQLFRAQAGLRDALIKPVDTWRDPQLVAFKAEDVTALQLTEASGAVSKYTKDDKGWTLTEPAGVAIDSGAVDRLIGAATRLRAAGFADDAKPADTKLDAPTHTLTFTLASGDPVTLLLGAPALPADGPADDAESLDRYVKRADAPWIYTVKSYHHSGVARGLADLRDKDMGKLDADKVQSVAFLPPADDADAKPLTLARKPGDSPDLPSQEWALTAPEAKDLPPGKFGPTLRVLTNLRAASVPDPKPADAGLAERDKARRVVLTMDDKTTHTLYLGTAPKPDAKDRYAQLDDGPIFILTGFNADKLDPTQDELLKPDPAPAGPPGGMGGMGGLPPGFKLPPGVNLPPGVTIPGAP